MVERRDCRAFREVLVEASIFLEEIVNGYAYYSMPLISCCLSY